MTFEDYLKDYHAKKYTGTDDNMPDAYEAWIEELDLDSLLLLGDMAIIEGEMRGLLRGKELAFEALAESTT